MVVLEAMAYGLPVVVSSAKFCGISASLTHEGNALILEDPLDVGALSDAVKRVLSDPHLVQRLSVAARNFARSHLWPAIAQKQEAIYAAACDGQSHTIC
jgi:glycosyltransferase involved in cell wall biosynthesis